MHTQEAHRHTPNVFHLLKCHERMIVHTVHLHFYPWGLRYGLDTGEGPIVTHPSALLSIYTINLQPHLPLISHAHPAGVPTPTAWQCHLPARETTGGIWSLGAEITKRLKIDPGNRDVVFPNPLTSNPSDIFLYCLVWFTIGRRLCGLKRTRMLWSCRGVHTGS